MKNKVKPTDKQLKTFKHMKNAKSLQEAMLKGGYSQATSTHPKQNFIEAAAVKPLIEQYREDLINAGFSTAMMAEIQVEGLTEQDPKVRLEYIRETKKDLGLSQPIANLVQNNFYDKAIENASKFLKDHD